MKCIFGLAFCFVLACAGVSVAAPFSNGSFEDPVVNPAANPNFNYVPNGGSIGGVWSVSGTPGVDQIGKYWYGYNSQQSVDLNGLNGAGTISQTFDTIAGQRYEVAFALSRNSDSNSFGVLQSLVTVTGIGTLFSDSFATPSTGVTSANQTFDPTRWITYSFQFVANSSSSTLSFSGDPSAGSFGPVLDAVSISEVPEPASLAVWGLVGAAGAMVGYRRRRQLLVKQQA